MNLTEKQKMAQRVSLPLEQKVQMTKQRIKDWIEHWEEIHVADKFDMEQVKFELNGMKDSLVYLAFSGGKDSTVLKHIIESMGYNVPCVFSNTGLEMPEIVKFARSQKNVIEIRPKMNYNEVWKKVGIPIGSKKVARQIRTLKKGPTGGGHTYKLYNEGVTKAGHDAPSWKIANKWRKFVDSDIRTSEECCDYLKKEPIATFEKATGLKGRSFTGMMASEGGYREMMTQCNTFEGKTTRSSPMLFWTDEDVYEYAKLYNVELCDVYYERGFLDGEMIACNSPYSELPTVQEIKSGATLDIDIIPIQGEKRTGCMFCGFGAHLEKGLNRFQKMSVTHPRQHAIVMDRMGMREAMEMISVKVDYDGE